MSKNQQKNAGGQKGKAGPPNTQNKNNANDEEDNPDKEIEPEEGFCDKLAKCIIIICKVINKLLFF